MKDMSPKFGNSEEVDGFIQRVLTSLYKTTSAEWKKVSRKKLLAVFKESYRTVPAYKKFILENNIKIDNITTLQDFNIVPPITKKNYLRAYAWEELCKTKALASQPLVMTATSGSTGEPFYFPRTSTIDIQSAVYHEMFMRSSKIAKNKSILVIDCFGMGVWIGGLITYQAFKYISQRGYPLTIITPGINKHEIFQALKNLGPNYDQIILCGYPPFMKDVVDEAKDAGIVWSNYNIKIIFAAEGFSETFRDYLVKEIGIKDLYRDTMNIYGSADLGTMAQESPLCILIRRLALKHQSLYMSLFGQATRLPTLAQYIPEFINFEEKNNSIYCTGDNALPLIRYEIGDNGGVLSYESVEEKFKKEGIDLQKEIQKVGITDSVTELPFVYVYERSDFAASFYGAIMYPEFIKKGLLVEHLRTYVTGKFTMYTKNDENEDQYLEINIELKPRQKVTRLIRAQVLRSIYDSLLSQSTEYKKLSESLGDRVYPKLVFWPQGHELHFISGAKQKWVKK